jgi:hypothetical protein
MPINPRKVYECPHGIYMDDKGLGLISGRYCLTQCKRYKDGRCRLHMKVTVNI